MEPTVDLYAPDVSIYDVPKRARGRPRKAPSPDASHSNDSVDDAVQKRPVRGRPCTVTTPDMTPNERRKIYDRNPSEISKEYAYFREKCYLQRPEIKARRVEYTRAYRERKNKQLNNN